MSQNSDEIRKYLQVTGEERFESCIPVKVVHSSTGNRLIHCPRKADNVFILRFLFRYWTRVDEIEYKKGSTYFCDKSHTNVLDVDKYLDLRLRGLLVSWNLDELNPDWKLYHIQGVLVDESFSVYNRLPSFVRRLVNQRMAEVLDYGR